MTHLSQLGTNIKTKSPYKYRSFICNNSREAILLRRYFGIGHVWNVTSASQIKLYNPEILDQIITTFPSDVRPVGFLFVLRHQTSRNVSCLLSCSNKGKGRQFFNYEETSVYEYWDLRSAEKECLNSCKAGKNLSYFLDLFQNILVIVWYEWGTIGNCVVWVRYYW